MTPLTASGLEFELRRSLLVPVVESAPVLVISAIAAILAGMFKPLLNTRREFWVASSTVAAFAKSSCVFWGWFHFHLLRGLDGGVGDDAKVGLTLQRSGHRW